MLTLFDIKDFKHNDSAKPFAAHRIFCIDCSGSMSGSLDDIRSQLKNKIPTFIGPNDFMSLIWFSGRGQFGTIFEHISIADLTDLQKINTAIDRYLKTLGCTGFVEPIRLAKELALKYTEEIPQVFFLSDGGENCWDITVCEKAFEDMEDIPMIIVEYQYYCDRDFLHKLAELSNATCIFNEEFKDYDDSFELYMRNHVARVETFPCTHNVVWMENGQLVVKKPVNGRVRLPTENLVDVYTIDENASFEAIGVSDSEQQGTDDAVAYGLIETRQQQERRVYIAMLYALQEKKPAIMKKCIAVLGDIYIARLYSVCFSKQDYSRLADHIRGCITQPEQYAFRDGFDLTFQPKEDAFTVVDLLELLDADNKTRFYPYHPSFSYSRISKERVDKIRFAPTRDVGSSITLVYNQSRANISIGCTVYGHNIIEEDETEETDDNVHNVQDYTILKETDKETIVPTIAYRNYTILKDGIKNVKTMPLSFSESVFQHLVAEGLIDKTEVYAKNKVYIIDITNLPVVNRVFASRPFTSSDFCDRHIKIHAVKSEMKYLKKMYDTLKTRDEESTATEYQRKTKDENAVRDFYEAPELQVKIAKCSAIPTINDKLLEKFSKGKALTPSEKFLEYIHNEYTAFKDSHTVEETMAWILEEMTTRKDELRVLVSYVEQAKMALLIGCVWFSDCDIDTKTFSVNYNNETYSITIEINNIKVYMD